MASLSFPDQSLRELLSAAAVDLHLRRRLKAHAHDVLAEWGVRAPGRQVYFVEPGETPAASRPGDAFIEMPALAPALADDALDAVAGGWDAARDRAITAVDTALSAVSWRHSDPWG